ncbi:MAG: DUF4271 domain-containing protein [Prevotella sp.]|nr:DUF4271 domain-containing protein [Prevotella sp.]
MRDSVALDDSVRQNPFGSGPVQGEVVDMINRYAEYGLHTGEDGQKDRNGHDGLRLPFNMEQTDGVFGLLLLCFLFFSHIYNGGVTFLKENISLLFSSEKSKKIHHQTTAREYLYNYFLVFQTVVLASICVYDIFIEFDSRSGADRKPFLSILSYMALIGLFLGIKDVAYMMLGYIFDEQKRMKVWRRTCIIGIEILGMFYFIPALLLVYANYYHLQIIIFMLILFLIVQLILFYQIIVFFIREKFNFLYLIAYLCAVEILPYIFLMIGLVYLYRIDVFNTLWL